MKITLYTDNNKNINGYIIETKNKNKKEYKVYISVYNHHNMQINIIYFQSTIFFTFCHIFY